MLNLQAQDIPFVNGLKAVTRYATASKLLFKDTYNFVSSANLKNIYNITCFKYSESLYKRQGF